MRKPKFKNYQEYFRDKFLKKKKENTVIITETTGSDSNGIKWTQTTATYGDPSQIVYDMKNHPFPEVVHIPTVWQVDEPGLVEFRTNHPTIFDEFVEQQEQEFRLLIQKNQNYGTENIWEKGADKKEALQGLYFRMRDKLNRFKQLIENGSGDEPIIDTLQDLSNYANISIIVEKEKWH